MGLSADQVKAMGMWEFSAQMLGWSRQFETEGSMSGAQADEIWDWMQSKNLPLAHHRRPH